MMEKKAIIEEGTTPPEDPDKHLSLKEANEKMEKEALSSQRAKLQLITGGYPTGLKSVGTDFKEILKKAMADDLENHATKRFSDSAENKLKAE